MNAKIVFLRISIVGVLNLQSKSYHRSYYMFRLSHRHIKPLNKCQCTLIRLNGWIEIGILAQFQGAQIANKIGHICTNKG